MARQLSFGDVRFEIAARPDGGQWVAEARREGRRESHGPAFRAGTEEDALDRCAAWLGWQQEHEAALRSLQGAERVYQRAVAAGAFAPPGDGPGPDVEREALQEMEVARGRLEEVRQRQPSR
ncbi:MAG TPA: hypothetical protein VND92_05710 [Vicinamibacterales bacterium]|nr:hypothetical protein [Vicinamibacterales bacterium]